jgi:hypothetical protein
VIGAIDSYARRTAIEALLNLRQRRPAIPHRPSTGM